MTRNHLAFPLDFKKVVRDERGMIEHVSLEEMNEEEE